jgi:hypothetical protein
MRLREIALLARCSHSAIVGVGTSRYTRRVDHAGGVIGRTRFRLDDGTMWIELEHMAGRNTHTDSVRCACIHDVASVGGNIADKLVLHDLRLSDAQTAQVRGACCLRAVCDVRCAGTVTCRRWTGVHARVQTVPPRSQDGQHLALGCARVVTNLSALIVHSSHISHWRCEDR